MFKTYLISEKMLIWWEYPSNFVGIFCQQRGEKMTRKEVQNIIDEVDSNKDGKLDYKEVILV